MVSVYFLICFKKRQFNVIIFQNVDVKYIFIFQNVDVKYIFIFQNVDIRYILAI